LPSWGVTRPGSGLKKEMECSDWSWAGPRLPHRYVVADSAISVTTDQDRYLTYLSDRSHWAESQVDGKSIPNDCILNQDRVNALDNGRWYGRHVRRKLSGFTPV